MGLSTFKLHRTDQVPSPGSSNFQRAIKQTPSYTRSFLPLAVVKTASRGKCQRCAPLANVQESCRQAAGSTKEKCFKAGVSPIRFTCASFKFQLNSVPYQQERALGVRFSRWCENSSTRLSRDKLMDFSKTQEEQRAERIARICWGRLSRLLCHESAGGILSRTFPEIQEPTSASSGKR